MKRATHHTLVFVTCSLLLACGITPEAQKILDELQQIATGTPVHPSFTQLSTSHIIKREHGTFSIHYQSQASLNEVKDFYFRALTAKGWSNFDDGFVEEEEAISFRKGEYTISIFNEGKSYRDYSVSYSWRLR